MANRYWNPSGAATWGTDTGVWATTDGGDPTGVLHPTTSDDVFFTATNVNNCTVGAAEVCKSITATGYTGTIAGSAAKTNSITLSGDVTTTGTLTINGNSAINRLLICSSVIGTPRTISAGTIVTKWVDWKDITAAGAANWNLTLQTTDSSGNCGGNTGITFTTADTWYWFKDTGSFSSTVLWFTATGGAGTRIDADSRGAILPQDTCVFDDLSFSAGSKTVTQDMPRIGTTTFLGDDGAHVVTNSPTWTYGVLFSCFGSMLIAPSMTTTTGGFLYFEGRAAGMPAGGWTIQSSGTNFIRIVQFLGVGGTYKLLDDFNSHTDVNAGLRISAGTFNANNFNVKVLFQQIFTGSLAYTINMGNGTWELTSTGDIWQAAGTINAQGSTIKYTNTTNTACTFTGGTQTYNNVWFSRGASTASNTISGDNVFNNFRDNGTAAHSILTTAGSTQTFNSFTVSGTSGNLITLESTTATGHYHFIKSGGGTIGCNFLNIQHSVATPTGVWYAGIDSVNNQTDNEAGSGWIFANSPRTLASMNVG